MKKDINKLKSSILAKGSLKSYNDIEKLLLYIINNFEESSDEVIKQLLEEKLIDSEKYSNEIFYFCQLYNCIESIKFLLSNNCVNPTADYNYAIEAASRKGNVEIVKLLLEDGRADPSADDNYAIGIASQEGHVEVVKLLLEDGRVDPSACDNCAIREALAYGRADVVKLLLSDERVSDRCSFMKKIDKLISE